MLLQIRKYTGESSLICADQMPIFELVLREAKYVTPKHASLACGLFEPKAIKTQQIQEKLLSLP